MGMDDTVRVRLTDAKVADKGREIARLRAEITTIEEEKAESVADYNKHIKTLEAEVDKLCTEIREGIETKAQRELFATDEVLDRPTGTEFTAVAAAGALTDIAKRAATCTELEASTCPRCGTCTCTAGKDVAQIDCPLHGVNSTHAKALPTEPHAYVETNKPGECDVCGSGVDDPIHASEDEGGELLATSVPDSKLEPEEGGGPKSSPDPNAGPLPKPEKVAYGMGENEPGSEHDDSEENLDGGNELPRM